MANIASNEDRISVLTARLQNITKSSGTKYMENLNNYLQGLSLDGQQIERPFQPDTSAGIVWLVTLPILYFLVVFAVLGVIVACVWYTQSTNPSEQSGVASFSRTSSKRNTTFTRAGTSSHDDLHDSQTSRNTIDTISKASILSCTFCRTSTAHKIETQLVSPLWPSLENAMVNKERQLEYADRNLFSHPTHTIFGTPCRGRVMNQQNVSTPYKNGVILSSRSCSTDSFDDDLCPDNLRASMESQKLLRMGNSKIRADDTYSWSDNTAHTTGFSGKNSNESSRNLRGFQNPVFSAELQEVNHGNVENKFGDPLGFAADYLQIRKQNDLDISALNISSVSALTNHPLATNRVPHNSANSLFAQTRKEDAVLRTPDLNLDTFAAENGTKVGGSLPPLPPNHFHRREAFISSAKRDTQTRRVNNSGSLLDAGLSDLDRSLADSSADSTTLSLPSSIAKFHASKVQPLNLMTPTGPGFLASTQNPTPDHDHDTAWSLSTLARPQIVTDNNSLSICPNIGSFDQSFEGSVPVTSFLDGSFDVLSVDRHTDSLAEEWEEGRIPFKIASSQTPSDSVNSVKLSSSETSVKPSDPVTSVKPADSVVEDKRVISPDIYREGNARMKRLLSLDQLKSGKVSVEQRLRQFGYVRNKEHRNIYVEAQDVQEKSHDYTDVSWNSIVSSSHEGIENLTQEFETRLSKNEILTEGGRIIEGRPAIGQVIEVMNPSPSKFITC